MSQRFVGLCALGCLLAGALPAQNAPQPVAPAAPVSPASEEGQRPQGEILIQSHGDPPPPASEAQPASPGVAPQALPAEGARADVSDAERATVEIVSYDLDARVQLQRAGLTVRAQVAVRNTGSAPLRELPLQLSSTLHWESATLVQQGGRVRLTLAQHRIDTDADHTGAATEAVLSLPEPLAPGATASLDLFYSGTVGQNADRLAQLGASSSQQHEADWDAISPGWTGLRGFGDVLWYPVASPQLFLHEGNTLFLAVSRMRKQDIPVKTRLRLAVEYAGEPPVAAYFCGRRADLKAVPDDPGLPIAVGTGIATAEFGAEPLGFRLPSLFILREKEQLLGGGGSALQSSGRPSPSSSSLSSERVPAEASPMPAATPETVAGPTQPLVALVSADPGVAEGLGKAADEAAGLLVPWLGREPLSALTVLDHAGQPFQDGPLLVAPAATLETSPERPALVYSLTHAWVQTGQPWMDEGLAQFFALLWVERDHGRPAALAALQDLLQPVALAEPNFASANDAPAGQPLLTTADELFYRRKAAAVWWMLRDMVGDEALSAALSAWRLQPVSSQSAAEQAGGFERLLEKGSDKDLGWFFQDWILRDRGLPDLSIQAVEVSRTPAGAGHSTGWLLAITVRNEGGAAAEVPVIVRSSGLASTVRVRVPGFGEVSQRVVAEATPTEVVVNDGSVPELRAWTHTRSLAPAAEH